MSVRLFRLSVGFYRSGHYTAARVIKTLIFTLCGAVLPYEMRVGTDFHVGHHGLGIVAHPAVTLGDRVFLHHGVTLGTGLPRSDPRRMIIGNRVTVGVGAILLGPITIGDDVMINAGSVVTRDVPTGVTVGGNPAMIKNNDGARLAAQWNPAFAVQPLRPDHAQRQP